MKPNQSLYPIRKFHMLLAFFASHKTLQKRLKSNIEKNQSKIFSRNVNVCASLITLYDRHFYNAAKPSNMERKAEKIFSSNVWFPKYYFKETMLGKDFIFTFLSMLDALNAFTTMSGFYFFWDRPSVQRTMNINLY